MAVGPPTARRLRGRGHPAARGLRHAAAHHHAPLPAFGAPAPERRHRGMGAGARRARALAGLRTRCRASVRCPCRHPSPLRAAGMARYVLRLARAGDLRRGARALGLAPPARAPDVLRRGHADVVAGVHGRFSDGIKALYLFAAFVLASPLGLLLALIPRPVYDFYKDAPQLWGLSDLADQQIAGLTMAVEQAIVFFAVFAYYFARFLRTEQIAGVFSESPR